DPGSDTAGLRHHSAPGRHDREDSELDRRCQGRARLRANYRAQPHASRHPVDEMLSHVTRPRCANWSETSESAPPCGYSPAPSRTVGYVDIFLFADHGPLRPCRSPLGILLLVRSESPPVAAVAAFHATCARSA